MPGLAVGDTSKRPKRGEVEGKRKKDKNLILTNRDSFPLSLSLFPRVVSRI